MLWLRGLTRTPCCGLDQGSAWPRPGEARL